MFIKPFKYLIYIVVSMGSIILLFLISLIIKKKKRKKVIFGTTPVLNNKYWSNALKEIGIESETLMRNYYAFNKKDDYDIYFDDLVPKLFRKKGIKGIAYIFFVWLYIINNAKVFVMPFHGAVITNCLWKFEYLLFKLNGIKTIVLPFGSDVWMYSRIRDISRTNSLLIDYPRAAKEEKAIEKKVFFWSKYADLVLSGFMSNNGVPRWDITIFQYVQINTDEWHEKRSYSLFDGKNGAVKVLHTPNHRGVKGTEFLIHAVDELKKEGLEIDLLLVENVQNSKVKELMQEVDILAEQFIGTNYALSGIEGMASGLPVMSNLEDESLVRVFRRYSFLEECPILSTSPETLKDNLRLLVTNPELRRELGELGRKYTVKYHSYKMAQYLFTNIFRKLDGEDLDLMNLFHPLKSKYVQRNYIKTGLVKNNVKKTK